MLKSHWIHNNANRYITQLIEDAVLKVEKIEDSKKDIKCMINEKCAYTSIILNQKVEKDKKNEELNGKVIEKVIK